MKALILLAGLPLLHAAEESKLKSLFGTKPRPRPVEAKKAPPKERTVQELTAFALKEGKNEVLQKNLVTALGFNDQYKSKHVYYRYSEKPSLRERGFSVVEDRGTPFALIWDDLKIDYGPGKKEKTEIWAFRTDLKGVIEQTMVAYGDEGGTVFKTVPANDIGYKTFADLHSFLLKEAVKLNLTKDK